MTEPTDTSGMTSTRMPEKGIPQPRRVSEGALDTGPRNVDLDRQNALYLPRSLVEARPRQKHSVVR